MRHRHSRNGCSHVNKNPSANWMLTGLSKWACAVKTNSNWISKSKGDRRKVRLFGRIRVKSLPSSDQARFSPPLSQFGCSRHQFLWNVSIVLFELFTCSCLTEKSRSRKNINWMRNTCIRSGSVYRAMLLSQLTKHRSERFLWHKRTLCLRFLCFVWLLLVHKVFDARPFIEPSRHRNGGESHSTPRWSWMWALSEQCQYLSSSVWMSAVARTHWGM